MTPRIYEENGFVFFFVSADGSEPPHVHVRKGGGMAKIWLEGCRLEYAKGFNKNEVSLMLKIAENKSSKMLREWRRYFGK